MTQPTTNEFDQWIAELEAAADVPPWLGDTVYNAGDDAFVDLWARTDALLMAPDEA